MSLNKEYTEKMQAGVKALIEGSSFDKVTGHVTFSQDSIKFPEGVTNDSLKTHVNFINDLSAQTEAAVAQVARDEFKNNDKLTTVDGSINFDFFSINSQHHLKQQVGEEFLFGMSTTAVDYVHSDEQAQWLNDNREANLAAATKLFG